MSTTARVSRRLSHDQTWLSERLLLRIAVCEMHAEWLYLEDSKIETTPLASCVVLPQCHRLPTTDTQPSTAQGLLSSLRQVDLQELVGQSVAHGEAKALHVTSADGLLYLIPAREWNGGMALAASVQGLTLLRTGLHQDERTHRRSWSCFFRRRSRLARNSRRHILSWPLYTTRRETTCVR